MTTTLCPQFPQFTLSMPLGIGNESTRTIAHAYSAFGLSRDGALPKAIHVGKPDDAASQHFVLYPGGKQVDLSFPATLLNKDRASLQCFESAIGFDRKMYEDKKDAVDQKTPLARFYQDQILEVWDPILKSKTDANEAGQPVIYKDLLKFWDDGVGDANTSTLNLAALQAILEHIEKSGGTLTVKDLLVQHDQAIGISLQKGSVLCNAVDWGKTLYMSDKKEYQLVCSRPANLSELALLADKSVPEGSFKITPSNFGDGAQQLKALNLKPADLKEAATAFEVMPASPQAALDATGYGTHHAVSKAAYWGVPAVLAGVAILSGIGGYFLGRSKAAKQGNKSGPSGKSSPAKAPESPKPEAKAESKESAAPMKKTEETKPEAEKKPDVPAVDDIEAALNEAAKGDSRPSNAGAAKPGATSDVSADNVVIKGSRAEAISGIDPEVIRAQVILSARRFLSEKAAEALQNGKPLPSGYDLIRPEFKNEVQEIVDKIVIEYASTAKAAEGKEALSDLWKAQLEERGYIVRRGVPQSLLIEAVTDHIRKHSKVATSPFAGGVGAEICSEAARHAGESQFLERGLKEIMRHIGR